MLCSLTIVFLCVTLLLRVLVWVYNGTAKLTVHEERENCLVKLQ